MEKLLNIRTSSTSPRYWYAYGYKTADAAAAAIDDMYADGEISPCDAPRVAPYTSTTGERRYGVQLLEH